MSGKKSITTKSQVERKTLRSVLTVEKLGNLLLRGALSDINENAYDLADRDKRALRCIRAAEKLATRYVPNDGWYEYAVPGEWKKASVLHPHELNQFIYGFPTPIRIQRRVTAFLAAVGQPNEEEYMVCTLSILSASPQLGMSQEQSWQPPEAKLAVLVRIWYRDKEYDYCLSQWDLNLDVPKDDEAE